MLEVLDLIDEVNKEDRINDTTSVLHAHAHSNHLRHDVKEVVREAVVNMHSMLHLL